MCRNLQVRDGLQGARRENFHQLEFTSRRSAGLVAMKKVVIGFIQVLRLIDFGLCD